ncbi:MAG: hypothetical protein L0Y58_16650 [Verrucomicrobia subdivision 3 bacterium]|nr:hypothetical protein [Limisphaerales bacterium]
MRLQRFIGILMVGFALCLARSAHAGTNGFVVPFFRGSANSEAGYWETFTAPVGSPGNLPDRAGATTDAVLSQSQTNAFLTGSGNIYNLEGVSAFTVSDATPFMVGTVVLQTRTLGTELDYGSMSLQYSDGAGTRSLAPLARYELNRGSQPGLGATVSSLWQWDLSGLGVTNYWLSFRAAGPSTSFDSMTLDTSAQFAPVLPQPFVLTSVSPSIERWMYAHNAAPCDRPAGSVFGTFGDESGVDTRHAQHLVGWDTAMLVLTNRGAARYLVRHCRVTLTINRGNLFAYDPTQDGFRTYFETNHSAYLPDSDTGQPIELFGVGFRNGFDAASFDQCASFGTNAPGQRNAFASCWSTNGELVDVSNNVGKTNEAFPRFEVAPFAIGQTTNAAPGELVPAGAKITFDLNLNDPLVLAYLQTALDSGRLRLMVSALHMSGGQFGQPSYPDFATHFNEVVVDPTRLELDGVVVRDTDSDTDGLPDDWENFYFASLTRVANDDSDGDGRKNLDEFHAGTDPSQAASALRLLSCTRDGNERATLRFSHAANRRYVAQVSEDFQTWSPLTNRPVYLLGTNLAEWVDEASAPQRFYRIRAEPVQP